MLMHGSVAFFHSWLWAEENHVRPVIRLLEKRFFDVFRIVMVTDVHFPKVDTPFVPTVFV